MDIPLIHQYLSQQSYWAKGRSVELVEKSIDNSLCFGVFDENENQIAFARIATDFVVFAWLMDVFVKESHKGIGVGKLLMDAIVYHPDLTPVKGIGLRTNDAHNFYRKYGFDSIPDPETWMFKMRSK
ncbi:GNAT family N-acetyltransferase [Flagellimonas sp. S3867]|uniref:GNAT family N-acetyltransferase n=1 Tax=Flagellimonas sp. S3867 TaxID=2768063 RepID=UPI001CC2311B|nr:GNAT family N-acetyltransferase [Flagellimonas sp. S3867]